MTDAMTPLGTPPTSARPAWRFANPADPERNSLPEVFASVRIPGPGASWLRRFLAFVGPGYMVSVGYMDPGNWLQTCRGRAVWLYAAGGDHAVQLYGHTTAGPFRPTGDCHGTRPCSGMPDHFPPALNIVLWLACELAIIACDLAEVIGTAVALQLLFGLPLLAGTLISALDAFIVLLLMNRGFRYLEAS